MTNYYVVDTKSDIGWNVEANDGLTAIEIVQDEIEFEQIILPGTFRGKPPLYNLIAIICDPNECPID